MSKEFKSLLILSTGRTGTKFLAKTLQVILPHADVFHEGGERSRLINILSHAHLAGFFPRQGPVLAWRMAIQPALTRAQQNTTIYIDANNHLYVFGTGNPGLYPNLKIIHIVRDPRDYIRSHINWSKSRLKSFIANYLVPFWQPSGFLLGEYSWADWSGLNRLERYAWIWSYKNRLIQQMEMSQVPYLRIKFEDLFGGKDPGSTLADMLDFIGFNAPGDLNDYFARTINASKQHIPTWPEWTGSTCQRINAICGELMRSYGYGSEPEWQRKCSQSDRRL